TQASPDCEKPRSLWIEGSATFTIVWSRMIISIPAQRTTRAIQRLRSLGAETGVVGAGVEIRVMVATVADRLVPDDLVRTDRWYPLTGNGHHRGTAHRAAVRGGAGAALRQ